MAQPNVLILRAPGTNCDRETAYAFEAAGAGVEVLHINSVLENPAQFGNFQILCIPGGFSYGDDVAAGRILANQIQHHLYAELTRFKEDGKLILGICNGFQVLIKSGVLLDNDPEYGPPATLTWNDSGQFEDRWVQLGVEPSDCVFLRGIDSMYLPVAHAEGKFVTRDDRVLSRLDGGRQLVLRYRLQTEAIVGEGKVPYPDNPNGSMANVAGLSDKTGRVLGLMPHPERHIDRTHHPRWTRGEGRQPGDGMPMFLNAVNYFA
ncbi:MAG: phosphoribosylformylglycinamidine synthase I [Pirellulales bacterium]|nr:phosphoribosylformylglycinamidine synthase I [Pirellulales bacterium]